MSFSAMPSIPGTPPESNVLSAPRTTKKRHGWLLRELPASRPASRIRRTASAGADIRAQIQEEIDATKKQRKRATREREYGRQLDRQREEIHPSQVLSELESLRPPPPASLHLPKAKPDPDGEYPVQVLPIRPFKTENDA